MRIDFNHCGPKSLRMGIVVAQNVQPECPVPQLEEALQIRLRGLADGLNSQQDVYRTQVRDIFRNGRYKPTGRGKPASEYLLRAAAEGRFPRINTLVDICNYVSVASLFPISIWDLDKAANMVDKTIQNHLEFEFRLGAVDEHYIFNAGGQDIELEDLLVGSVLTADKKSIPIVNAVKDCQATKTTPNTQRVAAAVYAPIHDGPDLSLQDVCQTFCELLAATDESCQCTTAILEPAQTISLTL